VAFQYTSDQPVLAVAPHLTATALASLQHVRCGSKADMSRASAEVRFVPTTDIGPTLQKLVSHTQLGGKEMMDWSTWDPPVNSIAGAPGSNWRGGCVITRGGVCPNDEENGQVGGSNIVGDDGNGGSTAQTASGLMGNPAVCYRPPRSRVHLGNVG
jgi:hypothetical protein